MSVFSNNDNKSWQEYVKQAEHYKAIGETNIYLFGDGEKPWQYARTMEPGSSHRLEISTSVRFTAYSAGLTFSWSFDIEPSSASGRGGYHIDVEGIQKVLAKLPMEAATNFVAYLKVCADAIEKKADEYQAEAKRQYGTAVALRNSTMATADVG